MAAPPSRQNISSYSIFLITQVREFGPENKTDYGDRPEMRKYILCDYIILGQMLIAISHPRHLGFIQPVR